jgi:hypothetical protein
MKATVHLENAQSILPYSPFTPIYINLSPSLQLHVFDPNKKFILGRLPKHASNISRYCHFKKGSKEIQERREEEKGGIGKNTPVQGDEGKDEI